jgi:hypothetical protein
MLFKILIKRDDKQIAGISVSLSHETQMRKMREELEREYPSSQGYRVTFHPDVKLDSMYSTGSFFHLPSERRK